MKYLSLVAALALSLPAWSQEAAALTDTPEAEVEAEIVNVEDVPYGPVEVGTLTLDEFLWLSRVAVVFAETPLDPAFVRQMQLLTERLDPLMERDVVILTDTDPAAKSAIRVALRPRGFALVIVDKDGRVMLRKPAPWDVREITRAIDKTPLREQEVRDQQAQ